MRKVAMSSAGLRTALHASFCALMLCGPAHADDTEAFYRGRTLTWALATTPGGSWDVYLRALSGHLAGHIPGKPRIVVQYMPGAGGVRMLDYMYNVAPKDGTALATPLPTSLLTAALEPDKASFKPVRFQWIGSMASIQDVITVWHTVPVKSIADARSRTVLMGVTGAGSNTYFDIALANNLLGTKFKPVTGYQGSVELNLAMERGETEGRANTWDGWTAAKPDWIAERKIVHLAQIGLKRLPEIGDVPLLSELVERAEDKRLIEFLSAGIALGRTIFMPPEVPSERVAAVRRAFAAAMVDPAYLKEASALKLSTGDWMAGEQLQDLITRTFGASASLAERAKKVLRLE